MKERPRQEAVLWLKIVTIIFIRGYGVCKHVAHLFSAVPKGEIATACVHVHMCICI